MPEENEIKETNRFSFWKTLGQKLDFSGLKPQLKPGGEEACFVDRQGQEYFVVKAPGGTGYIKLGLKDYFLYSSFSGQKSIQQVLVDYFKKFGALAFSRIGTLYQELFNGGFLTERPARFYQKLSLRIKHQRPLPRIIDLIKTLPQRQWPIPGFDRLAGTLYRAGFWVFFTLPAKILSAASILAGLAAFVYLVGQGHYSVLKSSGSVVLGMIVLILLNYLAVITHEMSHALACKHYKRQVNSGGTIFYMGFPAFYVDTTDAWFLPKKQRIFISLVGPYTQAFLAGAASLIAALLPGFFLNPLLYKFAFLSYISVFVNFNPSLELDGYYMLVDWLELPGLKTKATQFMRKELKTKLKSKEPFTWQEKVYAGFKLWSYVWSAFALAIALYFWRLQAVQLIGKFMRGTTAQTRGLLSGLLLVIILAVIGALFKKIKKLMLNAWQKLLHQVAQKPRLYSWGMIILFSAGSLVFSLVPAWFKIVVLVLFSALAGILFWRVNAYYRGSFLSLVFICLLVSSLLGMIALMFGPRPHFSFWLASAAAMFLAAYSQFSYSSLRRWRMWQRWLWAGLWLAFMMLPVLWSGLHGAWALCFLLYASAFLMGISLYWNNRGSSLEHLWLIVLISLASSGVLVLAKIPQWLVLTPPALQVLALLWLYLVIKGTAWQPETSTFEAADSERRRMRQAAVKIYKLSRQYFSSFFGESSAQAMDDRLNLVLVEKGWPIRLYGQRSEERFERAAGVVERSAAFKGLLDEMFRYISSLTGSYFARNTFKTAYESLYWEEREIAQQYLMPGCRWSEGLTLKKLSQERKDAQDVISGVARFWELAPEQSRIFFSRLKEDRRKAGEIIIKQGEEGDKFYIIKAGQVEVSIQKEGGVTDIAARFSRGDYFGEIALIKKVPRTATIKALSDCSLLTLERKDFELLMAQKVDLGPKIDRLLENRGFLVKLPLFSEFAPAQVAMAASRLVPQRYQAGQAVIVQGEIGDSFYIIKEGRFEVWVEREGQRNRVATLGPGEYFGEIALLLDMPRTASVVAQGEGLVLQLHKDDFKSLLGEQLYFYKSLEQASSRRLKDTRHKVS
jgi:putative peptide zinc metalloprotease protein